jgi:uncharacterized protein DUF4124
MKRRILLAALVLAAPFAGATYKCVNEKGITLIGDTPPEGCERVIMYEMSPTGHVVRKIDPTPSPDELKAYAADADKRRAAERAAAEQKRKDVALLNTYSTDKEIDTARDRNLEPIRGRIKSAQSRIGEVDKRLKEIDEEMEFYKAGKSKKKDAKPIAPPIGLVADRERVQKERDALLATIASSEKEMIAVKERYEADKVRFGELKGNTALRQAAQTAEDKKVAAETLIPGAAGKAKCGERVYECQAGQQYICREGYKRYPVNCVVERK